MKKTIGILGSSAGKNGRKFAFLGMEGAGTTPSGKKKDQRLENHPIKQGE